MGIEYLYHDGFPTGGKRKYPEDGIVWCPKGDGTFGVLDGISFFSPSKGPRLLNGLTQGQLAVQVAANTFSLGAVRDKLGHTLIKANDALRDMGSELGLSLGEPETLPGAHFAIAKFRDTEVSIVHSGDCGAVWQMKDGSFHGTVNQSFEYEREVEVAFASIKDRVGGDINAAWDEWLPFRKEWIRHYQNKRVPDGWALLTGELGFEGFWLETSLPRDEISVVILYTDGFVNFADTAEPDKLAQKLIQLYWQGGLGRVLEDSRKAHQANLPRSSEAVCPEATAVAITF